MSLFDHLPWDAKTPPAFVNAEGVKWWPDRDSTEWAHRENVKGTKLPGVTVWFTEHPDGEHTRVVVMDGQIEFSSTRMEDIGCHIDILKVRAEFEAAEKARNRA